jgi:hypothetical protein
MTLISLREFARRNGVSPEAVSKAVRTGRLPAHDGKLDPVEAQAAWDRAKDPARAGQKLPRSTAEVPQSKPEPPRPAPAPFPSAFGGQSYTEAKTRRENIRAMRDQVELKRLLGEMVEVKQVRIEIDNMIRNAKSKLLGLGHKVAPRLAIESDAAKCQEIVDDEVRQILADLAESGGQA